MGGGKLDPAIAFDEMSKLLFAKIQDERNTTLNNNYKFQIGQNENEVIIAQRCIDLYNTARATDPYVFTESISVTDSKIKAVVEVLQDISLTETDLDAKGQAFEKFLDVIFRGGLGQYFTRRQIVEFVVDMLDPKEEDIILDPSCGSGGFLLYCMKRVADSIRNNYAGNNALIARKIYDFSREKVYGIEINAKIARVAMMDMIVNDDGHTNIENNTGFNINFRNPNLSFGRFTLIMTNPPFGVKIDRTDRDNLGQNSFNNFMFGGSKKSQISDILFLEQYKKFLCDNAARNPRAGIVLQVGVLNNPSNKSLLNWLRLNFKILAIISLPDYAFRKAGSGMKTCLLFIKKYGRSYDSLNDIPNYPVYFAIAKHIGYDSTLRNDTNDLHTIFEYYRDHRENKPEGMFWINFNELEYRLDPTFYFNKFIITNHLNNLRERGHKIVPLSQLISDIDSGKSPEGGVTRSTGEIPSIVIENITKDGTLNFDEVINFVPEEFFSEFTRIKGGLKINDILIAKDGATTGKTAIINSDFQFLDNSTNPPSVKAIFTEHIFRLRLKPSIKPLFIHAFLNSYLGQLQLETVITGGAQGGITREFIDNIFIPVIEPSHQERIAITWSTGLQNAYSYKLQYENCLKDLMQSIETMIIESPPVTDTVLNDMLTE